MFCSHPLKGQGEKCYTCEYLYPSELRWVVLQPFLAHRGYNLRPRYQPDWIPSWATRKLRLTSKHNLEDHPHLPRGDVVIDAVRAHDNAKVVIKSSGIACRPRNNVVEVFDIMLAPDTDDKAFVVMPKLMMFAVIPFQNVGEVLDAFSQFLEGLSFIHEHNIAHMDVCFYNLMMDATNVAPDGFHMTDNARTEHNIMKYIRYKTRREVGATRYVIIDVGISEQFQPGQQPRYYGSWGQDKTIPEFQFKGVAHDPYKTDVCQLGNVLKRLLQHYEDLSVLDNLVGAMTAEDPDRRYTASESATLLPQTASILTKKGLKQRIFYKESSKAVRQLLTLGLNPSGLLKIDKYLFPELETSL